MSFQKIPLHVLREKAVNTTSVPRLFSVTEHHPPPPRSYIVGCSSFQYAVKMVDHLDPTSPVLFLDRDTDTKKLGKLSFTNAQTQSVKDVQVTLDAKLLLPPVPRSDTARTMLIEPFDVEAFLQFPFIKNTGVVVLNELLSESLETGLAFSVHIIEPSHDPELFRNYLESLVA